MNQPADRSKTALLIVDMQKGVVANAYARDKVIENINDLIGRARAKSMPVIWVQHNSEELKKDTQVWQYVEELQRGSTEPLVHKQYGDSFEDTNLESLLLENDVKHLVVAGAQTDACIRATIHGAFTRGYDTTLVSDAHTTEDLTAYGLPSPDKIIAFTNIYWTWQAAPGRKASVLKTDEIQF